MSTAPKTPEDYDDLIDIIEAIRASGDYEAKLDAYLDRLFEERAELVRRSELRAARRLA
jgi:hypothetical protein